MSVKIYSNMRRHKIVWWVAHKKEILSGPWKSAQEAWEAKQEWIV